MEDVCMFYDHLVYFPANWYMFVYVFAILNILWSIGIFFPFWFFIPRKNLATLVGMYVGMITYCRTGATVQWDHSKRKK
jgi:hypothetical protein